MSRQNPSGVHMPATMLAARISAAVIEILDRHNAGFFDDLPERKTYSLQIAIEDEIERDVNRWIKENGFPV